MSVIDRYPQTSGRIVYLIQDVWDVFLGTQTNKQSKTGKSAKINHAHSRAKSQRFRVCEAAHPKPRIEFQNKFSAHRSNLSLLLNL